MSYLLFFQLCLISPLPWRYSPGGDDWQLWIIQDRQSLGGGGITVHRDIGTTIIGQLIIKTNYTTSVGANLKMNILLQITVRSSKIPHKKRSNSYSLLF